MFIISFEDESGIENNKAVEVKVDVPKFHEFKRIDQLSEESVKRSIDEYNEGKDQGFQIKADELHKPLKTH